MSEENGGGGKGYRNEIEIGAWLIRTDGEGKAWIVHEGGEAMQTSEEKLAGMILEFWRREF